MIPPYLHFSHAAAEDDEKKMAARISPIPQRTFFM
jgi:hypothetical protein